LSGYIGQAALQMRLVFSSDANTTGYDFQVDEGFNIDNLKVIKSTTSLVVLPVHFINFTGRLKSDNTAELNWQMSTDSDPEYFVIEKSINGISFWELARTSQFNFNDRYLFAGNNYYRIKAVGRDQSVNYTNIINIAYKPSLFSMLVYPNPSKDEVNLRINTDNPGEISIRVTDLAGR